MPVFENIIWLNSSKTFYYFVRRTSNTKMRSDLCWSLGWWPTGAEPFHPRTCIHIYQWRIQNFPQVGAPTLHGGGEAPMYDFTKISQKLHIIEKIWTGGGVSKNVLCRSATVYTYRWSPLILGLFDKFEFPSKPNKSYSLDIPTSCDLHMTSSHHLQGRI